MSSNIPQVASRHHMLPKNVSDLVAVLVLRVCRNPGFANRSRQATRHSAADGKASYSLRCSLPCYQLQLVCYDPILDWRTNHAPLLNVPVGVHRLVPELAPGFLDLRLNGDIANIETHARIIGQGPLRPATRRHSTRERERESMRPSEIHTRNEPAILGEEYESWTYQVTVGCLPTHGAGGGGGGGRGGLNLVAPLKVALGPDAACPA